MMPMDMPPQQVVEYKMEQASPSMLDSIMAKAGALSLAAKQTAQEAYNGWADRGKSDVERMLPPLDMSSQALVKSDRIALLQATQANREGRLHSADIQAPKGYVGDRIRASMKLAQVHEQGRGHTLSAAEVKAYRCQVVTAVMQPRAGAYLQGGEKAATAARAAIPKDWLAECKTGGALAAQAQAIAAGRNPSSVRPVARGPMTTHPEALAEGQQIRINPEPIKRIRVNPEGIKRIRIDPRPLASLSKGPASKDDNMSVQAAYLSGRNQRDV